MFSTFVALFYWQAYLVLEILHIAFSVKLVSVVLQIPQVNSAALVVAYENGDPAHIHFLDAAKCQYYWKKWLDKLHQYWLLKSSGAASWRNSKQEMAAYTLPVCSSYITRGKTKLHHVN